MTEDDTRARNRFVLLTLLRLSGAAIGVIGLLVLAGKWGFGDPTTDAIVGGLLVLAGIFDVLVAPGLLAKRWKSD